MKALLLKDCYNLSKTAKTMAFVTAAYGIFGIVSGEASFLTGLIAVFCAIVPISTFSYDDFSKWDTYAQSMPLSRRTIVLEKYVLGLLLIVIGCAAALLFGVLTHLMNGMNIDLFELLISTACVAVLCLVLQALVFPIIVKFGVERGRIAMFAVFFIPAILIMIFAKNPPSWLLGLDLESLIKPLLIGTPIAAILLAVASFFVSLKLYDAKEF